MKIQASTILSFVTGKLYSTIPPTVLFCNLAKAITGNESAPMTDELPSIKENYSAAILQQLPSQFAATISDWRHTPDWQDKVDMIDEAWGELEITPINQ